MTHHCRFCSEPLSVTLVDLGATPWSNSFLPPTEEAIANERAFPLKVMVCMACGLAQTTASVPADEIFTDGYAYLSSYSASWLAHASRYADAMVDRFSLGSQSQVVEIASNDGYLLQYFVAKGVPVLGIEPAANAARIARERGVPSRVEFFNRASATKLLAEGFAADLMAANNVLAHVPDIADFVAGFSVLLKPEGVATFEFPHLLRLLEGLQFDTIYHEHYSYLSLLAIERILADAGLVVFDIEELPTHGGSLRLFVQHAGASRRETNNVATLRAREAAAGLATPTPYERFAAEVERVRTDFRAFIAGARAEGKTVAGYAAAAKGNTFLNFCSATADDITFVVDRNDLKQGRLLPGSHIPVRSPEALVEAKPDYVLILAWNLTDEIRTSESAIADWGGRFVTAVPRIKIW
jgi:SAM-dependent methyltransferase